MWEQTRQGQEASILRPSSEKVGLASSSITHLVATTVTPQEDSDHHTKLTQRTVKLMFRVVIFKPQVCPTTYGVYWRSRAGGLFLGRRQRR